MNPAAHGQLIGLQGIGQIHWVYDIQGHRNFRALGVDTEYLPELSSSLIPCPSR
jgi:hypothetical protein